MPHITLYGSGSERTVEIPPPSGNGRIPVPPVEESEESVCRRHQKASFAALDDMQILFDTAGVSHEQFWAMIRSEFSIVSRVELTAEQWAIVSARLNAARRAPRGFNRLVADIKAHDREPRVTLPVEAPPVKSAPVEQVDTCFVLRRNPNGEDTLVYLGKYEDGIRERCQKHATQSGCIVRFHYRGRKPEPFYPLRSNGRSPF